MRSQEEIERLIREMEAKASTNGGLDDEDKTALIVLYWVLGDDYI